METKIGGKSDAMKPVRLRLILVHGVEVRGAVKTFRDESDIPMDASSKYGEPDVMGICS